MPSNRIGRINEEIQRELASLIPNVKDPRVTGMISVTAVETTPDLRYTPELLFVEDDSIDKGAHILEMLRDPEVVKPANPANEHIVLDEED